MNDGRDEPGRPDRDESERPQWGFVRRAIVAVGVAAIAILLLIVLGRAIDVFLVTFAGVLLGVFLLALRDGLVRYTPLSRGPALAIVMVVLVALFTGGAILFAPTMAQQVDELSDRLPRLVAQAGAFLEQRAWGRQLLELLARDEGLNEMSVFSVAAFTTELLVFVVGFFVVGFFLAIQPKLYVDGLVTLFPMRARSRAHHIVEEMGTTLRWFLVARAIAMLMVGVSTAILLQILGIPLALLLGTIAGLLTFVPYLGPIAAGVPILVVSLFEGPRQAVLAVGLYTVIQSIEGYIFDPLIMQRVVRIPPAVTVVAQILGGVLFGVLGIVLAMPLAAVSQVLIRRAYREDLLGEPEPTERDEEEGTRFSVPHAEAT
jgi:predicted PurR-regulated permease PerM